MLETRTILLLQSIVVALHVLWHSHHRILEHNEITILDRETLRVSPIAAGEDHSLLRNLLAEVTAICKENQELKREVENLKSGAKRKLFLEPKESDPECSVSILCF